MKYTFESRFAERIVAFIEQKRLLGFSYVNSEYILYNFDRFCLEGFPNDSILSKEICLSWAIKRNTEQNNSFGNRLAPIREFAKYLNRIGEPTFIIPSYFAKKSAPRTPYIYSEEEISTIWRYFDEIKPCPKFPLRHFVIPAIIRLLYCCGLRPCEACKLKVDDVDLRVGKIYIRESKGHKDRIIMLADDVNAYYREYNENICRLLSGREWFFPSFRDKPYKRGSLDDVFQNIREKIGFSHSGNNPPRLYDFRHTFATHRLYQWLREGKDLTSMLPYLSTYMGHTQLSHTYYYIHLVPEQLQIMSGLDFSKYEALIPEVDCNE